MARTAAAGAAKRIGALSDTRGASPRVGTGRGATRLVARVVRSPRRDLFPLIFEFGQLACLARVIGRAVGGVAAESGLVV